MILYTDEARESWKSTAKKMTAKISEIPGNVLSYNDACTVARLLSMLQEYIDSESRSVSAKNDGRPRIIVEVEGGAIQNVYADKKADVDVLDYDNYLFCDDESAEHYDDLKVEAGTLRKVW